MRSNSRRERSSGQALIMTTVSLLAMAGLMGLAVDLGWSFFVKKAAQEAADAAALDAVQSIWVDTCSSASFTCSGATTPTCWTGAKTSCASIAAGSNAYYACQTAKQSKNGGFGTSEISVEANTDPTKMSPPISGIGTGANGVQYLFRVRVARQVPQLFSAVLGNTTATVAASATGALIPVSVLNGSLILTAHGNDTAAANGCGKGTDLCANGTEVITAEAGMLIASSAHNASGLGFAGSLQGNATITNTPYTWVQSPGTVSGWPKGVPVIDKADPSLFGDPMSGKGQPPIPTIANTGWATNGTELHPLTGALSCNPCTPGIYYMVNKSGQATGGQITVNNSTFACGSNCEVSSSSFGNYVFVGGLSMSGATVTLGPGRYILAGQSGGSSGDLLNLDKNVTLTDGGANTAGEILVLTDQNYQVNGVSVQSYLNMVSWAASCSAGSCLGYGDVTMKSGNGNNNTVDLYGLNKNYTLPGDQGYNDNTLNDFAPAVIWQDQGNSSVLYNTTDKNSPLASPTGSGNIVTSGSYAGYTCPPSGSADACVKASSSATTLLTYNAQGGAPLHGLLYQPRGASINVQGGFNTGVPSSPLQIITGSMGFGGSGHVVLTGVTEPPLTSLQPALIQ